MTYQRPTSAHHDTLHEDIQSRADAEADAAVIKMVNDTQAVIHFKMDGTIITANPNFLGAVEYPLEEVAGRHHSIFVDPDYGKSEEYRTFWADLQAGRSFTDQFPRVTKTGKKIWIQATYAPVKDENGTLTRVVKVATDITERVTAIEEIAQALFDLRDGKLTTRVAISSLPDMAKIATAYNEAVSHMSNLMRNGTAVSGEVHTIGEAITNASGELANRATHQASQIEQTAAAVEELTSSTQASVESARRVLTGANTTRDRTNESETVVQNAIAAMHKIKDSSDRIAQVISVIDDIAAQTNLLSLNAAIEAARAGAAGRGFAVVASEVRQLSQRSADSAREISELIAESQKHVTGGVDLVDKTGQELRRIFDDIGELTGNIEEIVTGVNEQNTALGDINSAVSNMETVTQENATLAEELSKDSGNLTQAATGLTKELQFFKLDQHAQAEVSPAMLQEYAAMMRNAGLAQPN